jgi:hypothetical protein
LEWRIVCAVVCGQRIPLLDFCDVLDWGTPAEGHKNVCDAGADGTEACPICEHYNRGSSLELKLGGAAAATEENYPKSILSNGKTAPPNKRG